MPKVQSKAGASLADVYDVLGSVAGVEELISDEVHLSHEMGAAIFSERFNGAILLAQTGDVAQNITFNAAMTDLPPTAGRIIGVEVFTNVTARVTRASVMVSEGRKPGAERELPIWVWDGSGEVVVTMRNNGTVSALRLLTPDPVFTKLPSISTGDTQGETVNSLQLRGLTSGFGAGTVELTVIAYLAFASRGSGVSSRGLPIPSW